LRQYNCRSDEIEAVDSTDAGIIFTVREPATFGVRMGDDSGLLLTRKVEVTVEQAAELDQINDPGERNQYFWEIALGQGVVGQLLERDLATRHED
jgi:hypothetical protein